MRAKIPLPPCCWHYFPEDLKPGLPQSNIVYFALYNNTLCANYIHLECVKLNMHFHFIRSINSFQHNWPFLPWSSFLPWLPLSCIFLGFPPIYVATSQSLLLGPSLQHGPSVLDIQDSSQALCFSILHTLPRKCFIHSFDKPPSICWWLPHLYLQHPPFFKLKTVSNCILCICIYLNYFKFNILKIELIIFFPLKTAHLLGGLRLKYANSVHSTTQAISLWINLIFSFNPYIQWIKMSCWFCFLKNSLTD